jgi:aspartyl-tRNA(Asn)/glutamyl-tRNA(Gln) amidotransferase subunit A
VSGAGPSDVHALGHALRAAETTSAALVERSLAAIEARNAELGAFTAVDPEGARAAAARADAELAAGTDRGPLHGLPVAIKDLIDTAGLATERGSRHFAGRVPEHDATCVRRLREAGAVVIGKTTTHEVAYGPTGDRSTSGPSRNPVDPTRMSGGSSGGSAAAVSAGLVPLALGTDTGGSVRIPAALCGVTGFKPAFGDVPVDGVFPLAPSFDVVGVLAGDAAGCRAAHEVLAGRSIGEAASPGRVGWVDPLALGGVARRAVVGAGRATLGAAGVAVDAAELPAVAAELAAAYVAIQSAEACAIHAERLARAPERFDPEVLERLRQAATVTPEAVSAPSRSGSARALSSRRCSRGPASWRCPRPRSPRRGSASGRSTSTACRTPCAGRCSGSRARSASSASPRSPCPPARSAASRRDCSW